MSDETFVIHEIPSDQDEVRAVPEGVSPAIDRDGDERVTPPVGAALSVLWWVEGEPSHDGR